MIIRLPIDVKSLFYNIFNDNLAGHTATVATVIKQGKSLNEKLNQVFLIDKKIDIQSKPDLIRECVKNSKTAVKIIDFMVFNKISVNGVLIESDVSYGIFIKQEIDSTKHQYGRIKMHYPNTLKYIDSHINVNNSRIMRLISQHLKDFAFLVNAFEYDTEKEILNFDITILGINNTPYSKVYVNEKGTGNKMVTTFIDEIDSYDMEIMALRKNVKSEISPDNYIDVMLENKKLAINQVIGDLENKDYTSIKILSDKYPYLPYDLEYKVDGEKRYIIVMHTSTNIDYFNLSLNKTLFISAFNDYVKICLVKNVNSNPQINYYTLEDLRNFDKKINSMEYCRRK